MQNYLGQLYYNSENARFTYLEMIFHSLESGKLFGVGVHFIQVSLYGNSVLPKDITAGHKVRYIGP